MRGMDKARITVLQATVDKLREELERERKLSTARLEQIAQLRSECDQLRAERDAAKWCMKLMQGVNVEMREVNDGRE